MHSLLMRAERLLPLRVSWFRGSATLGSMCMSAAKHLLALV